jgi:hypothetical protein
VNSRERDAGQADERSAEALQLQLVLEREPQQRALTLEPKLLADIGAVVFNRSVMDE